jgi:hypothetical protein
MRRSVATFTLVAALVGDAHGNRVASAAELHVGAGQSYATVQSAADAATAGDEVVVHAGSYAELVDVSHSGNAGAPIAIRGAGDGAVLIQGRLRIDGDHWVVSDLALEAQAGERAVRIQGSYNRLLRLELSGGDRDGVNGSGVGNEVRDCHIHDFDAGASDAHCIVLNPGAEDWTIAGNQLHDCSGDCIQLYAAGAERTIKNIHIEGNEMFYSGAIARMENAIDVKNGDGLTIVGNHMHGFDSNKVVVFQKGPANIVMRCNVMFDGFTGVEFRAEDGGTVENVVFARNLMHDFSEYALKFDGTTNGTVQHNTFVDIGGDGLRIELAGLDGGTVQNNLWVNSGALDGGNFGADYNGLFNVGNHGFAAANDVTGDPLLDSDYLLTSGSPMIDGGASLGQPYAGSAPDIGWYELGLDACAANANGGGGAGATSGAGGSSSGAGAAGASSGTTSGSGGSGAAVSAGGAGATAGPNDEGGCGCRVVATSRSGERPWALWTLACALGLAARRRRHGNRRRPRV